MHRNNMVLNICTLVFFFFFQVYRTWPVEISDCLSVDGATRLDETQNVPNDIFDRFPNTRFLDIFGAFQVIETYFTVAGWEKKSCLIWETVKPITPRSCERVGALPHTWRYCIRSFTARWGSRFDWVQQMHEIYV